MGLDMYLREQKYLGHYEHQIGEHSNDGRRKEYEDAEKVLEIIGATNPISEHSGSVTVEHTIAYWRKAHAIHGWFVENVQAGTDNCQEYEASMEALVRLQDACKEVLKDHTRAEELLPATDGFFFGMNRETPYDDYYFEDLRATVKMLEPIIERSQKVEGTWFVYQASW